VTYDTSLDDLKAALADRIKDLALELLGKPTKRSGREWRWGSKGGQAVVIRGAKRGLFHDHDSGAGGSPLDLIMFARGCGFVEAVRWARDWAGMPDDRAARRDTAAERERECKRAAEAAKEAADRAHRIATAQLKWKYAICIDGTVAERYLVETRSIPRPAAGWQDTVRFGGNCLILCATTADGFVQAVQSVYLTADAQKISEEEAERRQHAVKQTTGPLSGAAVRLPGAEDGPLLIAEGPETGLSLWVATGLETWIALGGMSNIAPPAGRPVVVCRDDDKQFSPTDRGRSKTINRWIADGLDIKIAWPWPERRQDKSDFNDTIKAGGPEAVRARVNAALHPDGDAREGRLPVHEARQMVESAVSGFFAAAAAYDPEGNALPPVHAVRVDVGLGKSRAARQEAAKMLAAMRARSDKRAIVIAVPTHALGEEQARAFEALPEAKAAGLTAAVWRGRLAPGPEQSWADDVPGP
jgi:putative DNA primase/helicase